MYNDSVEMDIVGKWQRSIKEFWVVWISGIKTMWCDLCVHCEGECQCLGMVVHTNWGLFCGVKRLYHKIILGETVLKASHKVSR